MTACVRATFALLAATLSAFAQSSLETPSVSGDTVPATLLDIPPRLQWNANYGYCGEVSFISAGLYFGQYCSQFEARRLVSPKSQSKPESQLLLGVNDTKAAQAMHLAATPWKPARGSNPQTFLTWVATQVRAGHPVAIGVFMNESLFYGSSSPTAGDPDYDHIVPVTAIAGNDASDSSLTFSDNGLWDPTGTPVYFHTLAFDDFPLTRAQANAASGPIYSLKNGSPNYGIAFTGVTDSDKVTIPVRVATSVGTELPAMKNKSNSAPASSPLTLTVTVSIPNTNVEYNLYRYNSFADVPDRKFNSASKKAAARWRIPRLSGPTFVIEQKIKSSDTVIFRAVPVSAP